MSHQYATLEDTVYLGFAANDTSGSGVDGTTPLFDVRLGGAAASAAPVLSGTPDLLTHANYGPGAYEVAVAATAANGFAAGNTYLVFVTVTADSQTPAACIGSFHLGAVPADVTEWLGTAPATPTTAGVPEVDVTYISGDGPAADNMELDYDGTGYNKSNSAIGVCSGAVLSAVTHTGAVVPTVTDVSNLHASAATAANQTTLLNRLGAFTGTGVNTVLGFFLALLKSDASDPSDVGGTYAAATDSLQAVRDRGDSAWITGGGGGITDILEIIPQVPPSIDLANTATWRLALGLINGLDDLPSAVEITPGTVSIHRKAIGGTSWSAVVTDAACSEAAGVVYYDEAFDSGSAYAEGDSIRVTFKSQKITVSANDYEITDATGLIFYSEIRQTMRGTDSAALASDYTSARAGYLDNINGHTAQTGDSFARLAAPAGASVSADIAAAKADTAAVKLVTDALPDAGALTSMLPTTAITESYAANGVAPTRDQALMAIHQMLQQFAIASTSVTVKKLDNTTTAFVVTLDSDTAPTSAART